ncbi:MAG: helix-turn-helix transcriptional regulator [Gemmatimonadaceae bacterium]|nr:helix-turn-helix transcriptional regulator [Gemmatimonadaceae bacterium]
MSSETVTSFGDVIAAERKRRKWSLRELAELVPSEKGAPVTPQYLNDIEHGRRIPADIVIENLAKALDIKKDVLFHLARKFPPDIPSEDLTAKTIEEAYKAFRRSLKKS